MTIEYTIDHRQRSQADLVAPISGRPPRVACLLALAHRFEELLRSGAVKDYAELARLGHVTPARVTQIMNLLNLAPDVQEYLLRLPAGPGIPERELRPIAAEVLWNRQRALFRRRKEKAAEAIPAAETLIRASQDLTE